MTLSAAPNLFTGPESAPLILDEAFQNKDPQDLYALSALSGIYVAQVLRIWDAFSHHWVSEAPLLFRLENADVVIAPQPHSSDLTIWTGALDTTRTVYHTTNETEEGRAYNQSTCLVWLPYPPLCKALAGAQLKAANLFALVSIDEALPNQAQAPCTTHSLVIMQFDNDCSYSLLNHQGALQIMSAAPRKS